MQYAYLSSTVDIRTVSESDRLGIFEVTGLYAGYGLTMGNAIRRILLSSLPGAAVTQIKVKNVAHEFSSLSGVKEDMVELTLNFKKVRFIMHTDETKTILLKAKGQKTVRAGDIETDSEIEVVNPDFELATLTAKDAELDMELTVEKGLGYSAVESRKSEKLPIGVVAIDAHFSPVVRVNYTVENMRVGERTDYNRLRLEIETDGSLNPSSALHKASSILEDHAKKMGAMEVKVSSREAEEKGEKTQVPKRKKKAKSDEAS